MCAQVSVWGRVSLKAIDGCDETWHCTVHLTTGDYTTEGTDNLEQTSNRDLVQGKASER